MEHPQPSAREIDLSKSEDELLEELKGMTGLQFANKGAIGLRNCKLYATTQLRPPLPDAVGFGSPLVLQIDRGSKVET